MSRFNVRVLTGQVALYPVTVHSGLLSWAIGLAQAPKLLFGSYHPYCHAAPVWVVEEPVELPYLGRTIPPGAYTVDATALGLMPTRLDSQLHQGASITIRDVPPSVRFSVPDTLIAERARCWHCRNIGRVTYDCGRLFRFLWRIPTDWLPLRMPKMARRVLLRTVCSSYTTRSTYKVFDYDDVPLYAAYWTSPSDLGATRDLHTVTHELRLIT